MSCIETITSFYWIIILSGLLLDGLGLYGIYECGIIRLVSITEKLHSLFLWDPCTAEVLSIINIKLLFKACRETGYPPQVLLNQDMDISLGSRGHNKGKEELIFDNIYVSSC